MDKDLTAEMNYFRILAKQKGLPIQIKPTYSFYNKEATGGYNPRTKTVRISPKAPVSTVAHEFAHATQDIRKVLHSLPHPELERQATHYEERYAKKKGWSL